MVTRGEQKRSFCKVTVEGSTELEKGLGWADEVGIIRKLEGEENAALSGAFGVDSVPFFQKWPKEGSATEIGPKTASGVAAGIKSKGTMLGMKGRRKPGQGPSYSPCAGLFITPSGELSAKTIRMAQQAA